MSERVTEEMVEALAMMLYTADRPSQLGDLAALVGVRFTIADQYQSARRIAAALAARPASGEPVAWALWSPDSGYDYIFGFEEQARQVATTQERLNPEGPSIKVVPLYTTPPAAAQDREDAERYRFLRDNPLQLRAIDGNATWHDKPADYFDAHTDIAMHAARAAGATDGK